MLEPIGKHSESTDSAYLKYYSRETFSLRMKISQVFAQKFNCGLKHIEFVGP